MTRLRLEAIALCAALTQGLREEAMPPHFFGLAQRNGSGAPKKNALVRIGAFFACFYSFSVVKSGHPEG